MLYQNKEQVYTTIVPLSNYFKFNNKTLFFFKYMV